LSFERGQITISITIFDDKWPNLTLVGRREGNCGVSAAITSNQQYDLAYNKFENDLHNLLRPAVDALITRRKGPKSKPGE
jgi:hypothetical protein